MRNANRRREEIVSRDWLRSGRCREILRALAVRVWRRHADDAGAARRYRTTWPRVDAGRVVDGSSAERRKTTTKCRQIVDDSGVRREIGRRRGGRRLSTDGSQRRRRLLQRLRGRGRRRRLRNREARGGGRRRAGTDWSLTLVVRHVVSRQTERHDIRQRVGCRVSLPDGERDGRLQVAPEYEDDRLQ